MHIRKPHMLPEASSESAGNFRLSTSAPAVQDWVPACRSHYPKSAFGVHNKEKDQGPCRCRLAGPAGAQLQPPSFGWSTNEALRLSKAEASWAARISGSVMPPMTKMATSLSDFRAASGKVPGIQRSYRECVRLRDRPLQGAVTDFKTFVKVCRLLATSPASGSALEMTVLFQPEPENQTNSQASLYMLLGWCADAAEHALGNVFSTERICPACMEHLTPNAQTQLRAIDGYNDPAILAGLSYVGHILHISSRPLPMQKLRHLPHR